MLGRPNWITFDYACVFVLFQGVRTSVLQLSNLEEGDYTFTLKVTDTAGQTDTADVHVFVKPRMYVQCG